MSPMYQQDRNCHAAIFQQTQTGNEAVRMTFAKVAILLRVADMATLFGSQSSTLTSEPIRANSDASSTAGTVALAERAQERMVKSVFVFRYAASRNRSRTKVISPKTSSALPAMWPFLIVRIASFPVSVAFAVRRDRNDCQARSRRMSAA